jgi:hypothetical protein
MSAAARRHATPVDQVDVLVGMLLEQARLMHAFMGGTAADFDYLATRARLYVLADAPAGDNSRADRYRAMARNGLGSSRFITVVDDW